MSFNIVQINIQSINNKIAILEKFLLTYNIQVALIQETWTKPDQIIKINSYNAISKSRVNSNGGGLAILVKDDIPFYPYQSQSFNIIEHLESKIKLLDLEINLVNFYNPNQLNIRQSEEEFYQILENNRLNRYSIIGGDINAASGMWNLDGKEDRLGKLIADVITTSTYSVINSGENTRMNLYNHTQSAIDITLASQEIIPFINWKVIDDTLGSDHMPIIINLKINHRTILTKQVIDKKEIVRQINKINGILTTDINQYSDKVNTIIKENTKTITINPKKIPKIWWNEKIEKLWFIKKEKLLIYNKNRTLYTAIELKKSINILKLEIKRAKTESWKKFSDNIGQMKPGELWRLLKSLGKNTSRNPILNNSHDAEQFLHLNFPQSYESFILPQNITTKPEEFTMEEFLFVIVKAKKTAPGFDKISFDLIKNMECVQIETFLKLLNKEWCEGNYPDNWKVAKVIGIPKPNTDHSKIENLRPISLLSVPAKITDKMVLKRMQNFAEENNIIPDFSFGFKQGKSINDLFVHLLERIEQKRMLKNKIILIKLDISKAFDNVDKSTLINFLHKYKFPHCYINWIYSFLTNRTVKLNSKYSHNTNRGVPQGSPLSPFLFIIYTAILHQINDEETKTFQFADDLIIMISSKSNETLKQNANVTLQQIKNILSYLKLNISPEKCHYLRIFPNFDPNFIISYENNILKEVNQSKILGITITNRLSLTSHYKILKQNAYKKLNILKTIIYKHNGAHPKNSLNIYKATTKSQTNFALVITDETKSNINDMIQTIRNNSLRVCTSMPKTTPIIALLAETGEFPSIIDNLVCTMRYMSKQIHKETPLSTRILNKESLKKFNRIMDDHEFLSWIAPIQNQNSKIPNNLTISPDLGNLRKQQNNEIEFRIAYNEMMNQHKNSVKIFTDASKSPYGQGIGIYVENQYNNMILESSIKIVQDLTIKTLETIAIKEAIIIASKQNWINILIITDSKSTCISLCQTEINPSKFYEHSIIQLTNNTHQQFFIQWVPGHSGIFGNNRADYLAKQAVTNNTCEVIHQIIPIQDALTIIKKIAYDKWKSIYESSNKGAFNKSINNNFPPSSPWIKRSIFSSKNSRLLLRMRGGHTFDKKYKALIRVEQTDKCDVCNVTEDFTHSLQCCSKFKTIRDKYTTLRKPISDILKRMDKKELKDVLNFYEEAQLNF